MKLFWLGMAALMSVWLQHPDQKDPDLDETDTVAIAKANFLFSILLWEMNGQTKRKKVSFASQW